MFGAWTPHVRDEIAAAVTSSLEATARSGACWPGPERVAAARLARAARCGFGADGGSARDVPLPEPAREVIGVVAATPAQTTQDMVEGWLLAVGVGPYVELVGITARTVAVDTFHRILGCDLPELPPASGIEPTGETAEVSSGRAWVPMAGFEVPPNTLSASPTEQAAANHLEAGFYMTGDQMADPDQRRGELHRSQIELVAATLSHGNECFY